MKVYNTSNDVLTMDIKQRGHMLVSIRISNYIIHRQTVLVLY